MGPSPPPAGVHRANARAAPTEPRTFRSPVRIQVTDRFEPARIVVPADVPVALVFSRETQAACADRLVFPDQGVAAVLRPFEDTIVELPPSPTGEYTFTCGDGRLRGTVVAIDPRPSPGVASRRPARLALPAVLLSVLLPGAGHLLLRAPLRGAIWMLGWILVARAGQGTTVALTLLVVVAAVDAFVIARTTVEPRARTGGPIR